MTAIEESPTGQMWAGYRDGYFHTLALQGKNKTMQTDSIRDASISRILFPSKDRVLIATYGKGLWALTKDTLTRIEFQSLSEVDDIYDALIDLKGRVWLATDNGIWIYQYDKEESLIHLDRSRGLPDEIVAGLKLENNGDVWIGLYDHGLARYIASSDSVIPLMPLQPTSGNVITLVKGRSGAVWIGTEKSVSVYSVTGISHNIGIPAECKERLETIHFDRNGNLWLASGNKLFIANTQMEYITPGIFGIQAVALANNKLWLGCEFGLYGMDLTRRTRTPYMVKEKMNILSMYTDPFGLIWIGTFGQGLYIYHPEKNIFLHLTEKDKISNNSILNIDGNRNTIHPELHVSDQPHPLI